MVRTGYPLNTSHFASELSQSQTNTAAGFKVYMHSKFKMSCSYDMEQQTADHTPQ